MKKKWTYKTCYEVALKCDSRTDFSKKYPGAYKVARENGWLDDYTWFENGYKIRSEKRRKWTYKTCFEAARNCDSRSDFGKKYPGAYEVARENGWLDEYYWFETKANVITDRCDNVYVYIFKVPNSLDAIYIGRTINPKNRDRHHLFSDDIVVRFAKENNLPVPEMQVVRSNLTLKEGQYLEDLYIILFKNSGKYNVLNTAPTGIGVGSIGSIGGIKWTYKTCYEAARKCETRNDFCKKYKSAYQVSLANDWMKFFTWFKDGYKIMGEKNKKWDYNTCFEAARNCDSRSDFQNKYPYAYNVARPNGWLDDFFSIKDIRLKPVEQILNGVVIATYSSTREAERQIGISHGSISNVCLGKYKTAGGFEWRFSA